MNNVLQLQSVQPSNYDFYQDSTAFKCFSHDLKFWTTRRTLTYYNVPMTQCFDIRLYIDPQHMYSTEISIIVTLNTWL